MKCITMKMVKINILNKKEKVVKWVQDRQKLLMRIVKWWKSYMVWSLRITFSSFLFLGSLSSGCPFFFSFSFFLNVSGLIHMQGCFRSQRGQVPPLAPSGSAPGCQYGAFVSIELRWRTRVSKTLYSSSSSFAFDFQWLGDVVLEPLVFFFFFFVGNYHFFKLRN